MARRILALGILIGLLLTAPGCAIRDISATEGSPNPEPEPGAETVSVIDNERELSVVPKLLPALRHPQKEDFVAVEQLTSAICVELKYAAADNFTGRVLYAFQNAYLRFGTAQKLEAAAKELEALGYGLKIWDAYRPVSAQFALWEACPDPNYVANPNRGFSNHTRGNAVDVTLVDDEGREVEMPTGFDDFSALADRDYSDCTEAAAENAMLLESVMERHGFRGYQGEWWHFSDTDGYDVETVFDPGAFSIWYADCREFITLRSLPDIGAEEICIIPKGEELLLLGYDEGFALVQWMGFRGYVLLDFIAPAQG